MVALLDVGFLAGVILITHFLLHGDTKIDVIGFLCAGLNIAMYASPLAAMVRNSIGQLLIIIARFLLLHVLDYNPKYEKEEKKSSR